MVREPRSLILNHTFKSRRPYHHQVRGLYKALTLDRATALMMDPGTGKTRITIDFAAIKHMNEGLDKVLVVCPKVALGVWEDQIEEYLTTKIDRQVITLSKEDVGSVDDRVVKLAQYRKVDKLTFVLVNYDVIYQMSGAFKKWKPNLIIADESHYIKKATSDRSRGMHSLGPHARWKFILSGTPITNSPLDIFSQFKFLNPTVFGTRWTQFKYEYAVYGGYGGFKLLKYKNLDRLGDKIDTIAFKATIDELDLPDKTIQPIRINLSPKARRVYDQMERERIAEINELGDKATAAIILTKILRLSQITGGFVKNQEGEWMQTGNDKLSATRELLEQYAVEGGHKVVVFTRFKPEEKAVKDLCTSMGIGVIADKGLKEDRKRFQKDRECKVFIVSLARGGLAVNELVAADIGLFYSLDSSSDHWIQALGRLHRSGQTRHTFFPHLLAKDTIDEDIFKALNENKDVADYVLHRMRRRVK